VPNRTTICLAALLTLCALPAAGAQPRRSAAPRPSPAQTPAPAASPQPAPQASPQVSEDEADLAITANVTAGAVRFEAVPNVTVEFPGRPRRETSWEAERTNLPRPVQPGVTYRDVGVRLKIVSVFADIDRIVAEALGEVPPSDGQTRPDAAPPVATPPAGDTTSVDGAAAVNVAAEARAHTTASRRARAQRAGRRR
jgi:hypothetical protein